MTTVERGMTLHRYWDRASCQACALKDRCTPSIERRVTRWEHEALIDALQRRMDLTPGTMRLRRRLVEHPFGTIKAWMGSTHFLMKRLPNVKTEIGLHVLAYNLRRVIAIIGAKPLIAAIDPEPDLVARSRHTSLRRRQRVLTQPRPIADARLVLLRGGRARRYQISVCDQGPTLMPNVWKALA